MKKLFSTSLSILAALSTSIAFAGQDSCVDELQSRVQNDPNTNLQSFGNAYTCGDQESACVITYENQHRPFPSYTIAAFLDQISNRSVHWAPLYENHAVGSIYAGKGFCSDVNFYLDARFGNDSNTVHVDFSKETARDAMFCPFSKTYFNRSLHCRKI